MGVLKGAGREESMIMIGGGLIFCGDGIGGVLVGVNVPALGRGADGNFGIAGCVAACGRTLGLNSTFATSPSGDLFIPFTVTRKASPFMPVTVVTALIVFSITGTFSPSN